MSYLFYLDDMLLPVPPPSLRVKIPDKDEVLELMNNYDFSILKQPGLTEFTLEIDLPAQKVGYAVYTDGNFQAPFQFTEKIKKLKTGQKPFQFAVLRKIGDKKHFDTNIRVSLAEYDLLEDRDALAFDVRVSMTLREFRPAATQIGQVITNEQGESTLRYTPTVEDELPETPAAYKVMEGDTLWSIAESLFDDGALYAAIQAANMETPLSPNYLEPGTLLRIPNLAAVSIPNLPNLYNFVKAG